MIVPPPLCLHPPEGVRRRAYRAECTACGSYWDLESLNARVTYDESYPERRGHFDPIVGALKVRTLRRWLRVANVSISGKTVCEVGFGGGSCIPFLCAEAEHVIGLEVNQSAIDRVRATAMSAELLCVVPLPTPSRLVDLWLFQDSFEHIPDPATFVEWMRLHSAPNAEILMVLPRADSTSRRLLGRYWPHKLPDHEFHWSRAGLLDFFARSGFGVRREFFPLKFASPQMILAHGLHKLGVAGARELLSGLPMSIPLNFGELGVVLARRA